MSDKIIEFPENKEISLSEELPIEVGEDWALMLDFRNRIMDILTKEPDIERGGSAGVGITGADFTILVDGYEYRINITPRDYYLSNGYALVADALTETTEEDIEYAKSIDTNEPAD